MGEYAADIGELQFQILAFGWGLIIIAAFLLQISFRLQTATERQLRHIRIAQWKTESYEYEMRCVRLGLLPVADEEDAQIKKLKEPDFVLKICDLYRVEGLDVVAENKWLNFQSESVRYVRKGEKVINN